MVVNEMFGSGVVVGLGIFCCLCFLVDGFDFEVEEVDFLFIEVFFLRLGVNLEVCSDDGLLLGVRVGFLLLVVV